MSNVWYPQNKEELESLLNKLIKGNQKNKINGVIVPHAGYFYSGEISGKAFSLLKAKKVMILTPNHYSYFKGVLSHNKNYWQTPLGKIKIIKSNFNKADLKQEHSIDNNIPFLQNIGVEEILPLSVGEISPSDAKEIAEKIKDFDGKFVVSTDLSHFNNEEKANQLDKRTIEIIEKLDAEKFKEIDACGIYPLMILMQLCEIKKWKPKLIEYKTSGQITGDFSSVVGYASFIF